MALGWRGGCACHWSAGGNGLGRRFAVVASDVAPDIAADEGVITWFRPGEGILSALTPRTDGVGRLQQRVKTALDANGTFIGYPALRPSS